MAWRQFAIVIVFGFMFLAGAVRMYLEPPGDTDSCAGLYVVMLCEPGDRPPMAAVFESRIDACLKYRVYDDDLPAAAAMAASTAERPALIIATEQKEIRHAGRLPETIEEVDQIAWAAGSSAG